MRAQGGPSPAAAMVGEGSEGNTMTTEALTGVRGPAEALAVASVLIDFPPPGGTSSYARWHQRMVSLLETARSPALGMPDLCAQETGPVRLNNPGPETAGQGAGTRRFPNQPQTLSSPGEAGGLLHPTRPRHGARILGPDLG